MSLNKTNLGSLHFTKTSSTFSCSAYTWILTGTSELYSSLLIKCIACPLTVCLNILIIVAVMKRRELDKNSNILLASLAASDLFVGAVSLPVNSFYEVLLLRKDLSIRICQLAWVNIAVLYGAVSSSLYHLTIIAFDRFVAIKLWKRYKTLITKARVKWLAFGAWLLALSTNAARKVPNKYGSILEIVSGFKTLICVAVILYCYSVAYISVRNRRRNDGYRISALRVAKVENTIGRAMAILTTVFLISYIPSVVGLFLGETVPMLRTSTYFLWSQLILQLNSLFNPVLNCFVLNRQFRTEVFKMLKIRSEADPPAPERRARRISPVELAERNGGARCTEGREPDNNNMKQLNPTNLSGNANCAITLPPGSADNRAMVKAPSSRRATVCGDEFVRDVQKKNEDPGYARSKSR